MTSKPVNWDDITPASFSIPKPKPEGYILKVIHAGDIITPKTHDEAIKFYFDIAEGEHTDYFKNKSIARNKDVSLTYLQLTKLDSSLPFFKRLMNFFEECNPGYKWDFNPLSLVGKRIGGVVFEKEYEVKSTREVIDVLAIAYLCPIGTIIEGNYTVPSKKLLDKTEQKIRGDNNNDYSAFFD